VKSYPQYNTKEERGDQHPSKSYPQYNTKEERGDQHPSIAE